MQSFVIDANILFNAILKKDGKTYTCIMSDEYRLYAPDYIVDELEKYTHILDKKHGTELKSVIATLLSHISLISFDDFAGSVIKRIPIMQQYDVKDTPYIALADHLDIPLRTNDKLLHTIEYIQTISSTHLFLTLS